MGSKRANSSWAINHYVIRLQYVTATPVTTGFVCCVAGVTKGQKQLNSTAPAALKENHFMHNPPVARCLPASLWTMAACTLILSALSSPVYGADNHACDYLTAEEVQQIMHTPVSKTEAQPANPLGQSICFHDLGEGMRFAQLQMVRSSWEGLAEKHLTAATLFANNMSFLDNIQDVAGMGEKAYWGGTGLKLGAGLHVLYQDSYFTVMAATGDAQTSLEQSQQLAQKVLARLK